MVILVSMTLQKNFFGQEQAAPSFATGIAEIKVCFRSWHFDFTYPLAYLAHTLTNVPMPGHAKHRAPTMPAKSGTAISTAESSKRAPELKTETKKGK